MSIVNPTDAPVVELSVDSIAALRLLPGGIFKHVLVDGYYTAGDGGGGLFRWNSADASADNLGTIIRPSVGTGRWNRIYDQASGIIVKWFGAKGDGVTDDTAAILAASVAGVAAGVPVHFTGGTFKMGSAIALTSAHNNLAWVLDGATIKKGFNGDLVTITNCTNFSIDGVGIFDGVMTSFTGKGFALSGSSSSYFYVGPGILTKAFAGTHVEYGADAGFSSKLMCDMLADASQPTPTMITCTGLDTSAMQRSFWGRVIGTISLTGALATVIKCPIVNQVSISSTCSVTIVDGCTWSNNGNAITIDGQNTIISGCRMAGDVTINAGTTGAYVGNRQTTATRLVNNSTSMTVLTEWVMTMPDGTAVLPGLVWRNNPATGFWQRSANTITASMNGADQYEMQNNRYALAGNVILTWGDAATISSIGAFDIGLARKAAGILQVNTGTLNTLRAIQAACVLNSNPNTQTGATYTVLATDSSIIANRAGTVTLTLEAASTVPGKQLRVRTIQAQTVVSAASDVVPLAGGAAGTAILAATAGRWALLESDGTNWQISQSN